nr:MAG TPA: hypothetical protein [Caudoviricetes sp.]
MFNNIDSREVNTSLLSSFYYCPVSWYERIYES